MTYRDQWNIKHPWTLGTWSGQYREVAWRGGTGTYYIFEEPEGKWAWHPVKEPRKVKFRGKTLSIVGTVCLWPAMLEGVGPQQAEQGETTAFACALELLKAIHNNRRLHIHAIPELMKGNDTEYAIWLEDHASLPTGGRVEIAPGIQVDKSGPGGIHEVQSTDGRRIARLAATLPMLVEAPDIPARLENLEGSYSHLERMVKRILDILEDSHRR